MIRWANTNDHGPMTMSSRARATSRSLSCAAVAAALSIGATSAAAAQRNGSIRGTVTAAESHGPIAGARVAITSPVRVAITDGHGVYVLRDIPAGSYVVRASAIGQRPDSGAVVVSPNGAVAPLDFELKAGSLLLSGMVVSATRTTVEASKVASTVN